jgi:hypothetical protein
MKTDNVHEHYHHDNELVFHVATLHVSSTVSISHRLMKRTWTFLRMWPRCDLVTWLSNRVFFVVTSKISNETLVAKIYD